MDSAFVTELCNSIPRRFNEERNDALQRFSEATDIKLPLLNRLIYGKVRSVPVDVCVKLGNHTDKDVSFWAKLAAEYHEG